jgi:hypothetical protein
LDAGRSILIEEGLGTVADALNFKRAFARVELETGVTLTNASVIGRGLGEPCRLPDGRTGRAGHGHEPVERT